MHSRAGVSLQRPRFIAATSWSDSTGVAGAAAEGLPDGPDLTELRRRRTEMAAAVAAVEKEKEEKEEEGGEYEEANSLNRAAAAELQVTPPYGSLQHQHFFHAAAQQMMLPISGNTGTVHGVDNSAHAMADAHARQYARQTQGYSHSNGQANGVYAGQTPGLPIAQVSAYPRQQQQQQQQQQQHDVFQQIVSKMRATVAMQNDAIVEERVAREVDQFRHQIQEHYNQRVAMLQHGGLSVAVKQPESVATVHCSTIPSGECSARASQSLPGEYNLYASGNFAVKAGRTFLLKTGVFVQLPRGSYALLLPHPERQKHYSDAGITVTPYTCVPHDTGAVSVKFVNDSAEDYSICAGDLMARLVIVKSCQSDVLILEKTSHRGRIRLASERVTSITCHTALSSLSSDKQCCAGYTDTGKGHCCTADVYGGVKGYLSNPDSQAQMLSSKEEILAAREMHHTVLSTSPFNTAHGKQPPGLKNTTNATGTAATATATATTTNTTATTTNTTTAVNDAMSRRERRARDNYAKKMQKPAAVAVQQ